MNLRRPARTTVKRIFAATAALLVTVWSCDRPDAGPEPETNSEPEVTVQQAERALGDVMLASAVSLLLAFTAEPGTYRNSTPDGAATLAWDETADFSKGTGVYTITFQDYTIPPDDPFGLNYNGHALTGTVVLASSDGVSTRMDMDLSLTHPEPEDNPVTSIDLELEGYQDSGQAYPSGRILINGAEMEFRDLTGAFEIGE